MTTNSEKNWLILVSHTKTSKKRGRRIGQTLSSPQKQLKSVLRISVTEYGYGAYSTNTRSFDSFRDDNNDSSRQGDNNPNRGSRREPPQGYDDSPPLYVYCTVFVWRTSC